MDLTIEMPSEMTIDKFWSRRLTGPHHDDETTAEYLLDNQELFPPAQVEDDEVLTKGSRPSSPFCVPCNRRIHLEDVPVEKCKCDEVSQIELDGSSIGDIPCTYQIPQIESHEMAAVGVYIDPRILPGFKYKIRTIEQNGRKKYVFGGGARQIESIGRGYSRRITLTPTPSNLNLNPDVFWTDSSEYGFALEIQVTSPGDKFTLYDANHIPVGTLEISSNQGPQVECGQSVVDGKVEKSVRVKALCKVEWFHEENNNILIPLSGVAVCQAAVGGHGGCSVTKVTVSSLGHHRGFTLLPGVCSSLRSVRVSGTSINDVPTHYTILGLEAHQMPVIGTYVDKRIVPGFYYHAMACSPKRQLFKGRALRLDAIGRGYAKRLTFSGDSLNNPDNHLWSDSHPEGLGLSHAAVRPGMVFDIRCGDIPIGHATVFRADSGPQVELSQDIIKSEEGPTVMKRVQIDVKCEVSLDFGAKEKIIPHVMRVSGVAVLAKKAKQAEAEILRIEDIGLDSQLNVLISHQWQELTFVPIKK